MSTHEVAKCLFKRGWADHKEWQRALKAYASMKPSEQHQVEQLGSRYQSPTQPYRVNY